MKKTMMAVFAAVLVLASSAAYAETVKEAVKKNQDWWAKEGERSGLKESTSSWGKFLENMNPVKYFQEQKIAYDARKSGSVAK